MHIKRQIQNFGESLRQLKGTRTIVTYRIAFDVTQQIPMLLREVDPTGNRHLAKCPNVAFDKVEPDETHRTNECAGIKGGLQITQKLQELIKHPDAGTASVHKRRNALVDTNRIGIGKTQRAIGMHVDIDPSGTKIMTGHIDD